MPTTLDELVTVARLPSPSAVLLRLFESMDRNTAQQTARIIESDPGITARVLRLANSSVYPHAEIARVRDAVVRIGMNEVTALVMATEVYRSFQTDPGSGFDMEGFWNHSLRTACLSRELARTISDATGGTEWTCGMLHDIGSLLIAWLMPREYGRVRRRIESGAAQLEAESDEFGFNHEQAGAYLLARWRLPAVIVGCAGNHHHRPRQLDTAGAIVAAANLLAHGDTGFDALAELPEGALEALQERAEAQFRKYRAMFADSLV